MATAQIDVKSGVTLTSNAINEALKAAAAAAPAGEAAPAAEETAAAGNVYEVTGFQPMKVEVVVDEAGKVASVNVVEHNETPGFGADLIAAGFDAVVGQDVATAQIDVKSGVTLTSNAINEALKAAAAAAPAGEAAPADDEAVSVAVVGDVAKTYEMQVKGMAKKTFTLRISVDDAGVIVAATCPENSEDKGYIALTDDALSALVGQNITDAKYDTVAGVTVTSNAVNSALDAIAAHVRNEEVQ